MINDTSLKMLHRILRRIGAVASQESGFGYVKIVFLNYVFLIWDEPGER